tara:strand:+ start:1403 stop:2386 length:984 start_codon:yes stop_codon:yes gene_type:complete
MKSDDGSSASDQVNHNSKPQNKKSLWNKYSNRFLKFLRRAHMYAGLTLLPWIILFGATGILFNHPTWFSKQEVVFQGESEFVKEITGFHPTDPSKTASDVLKNLNLNRLEKGQTELSLDKSYQPIVTGRLGYFLDNKDSQYFLYLNVINGEAKIEKRPKNPELNAPKIDGQTITINDQNSSKLEAGIIKLFKEAGISTNSRPRIFRRQPHVLFRLKEANGTRYNVGYNLISGKVSARDTEQPPPTELRSILTRLHRLHHYPDAVNERWAWSLFVDLTGLMLIFWGVSGLIMWWQIKPTRVAGIIGITLAILVAFLIGTGTVNLVWFF